MTADPAPARPRKKKSGNARLWLWLHGWLALPLWAYLALICITGTLATVSHEILWLADPEVRATAPGPEAQRLPASALAQSVIDRHPGSQLREIEWPEAGYLAPSVQIADAAGQLVTYYVDPYTGREQGTAGPMPFPEFLRALHGWLLLPWPDTHYSWGWYAVTAMGLPMLGSLITGILIYKKFWRAYLNPRLRIGKGTRIFWGDLHRLAGIWSLPFVAIIALSGTWFLLSGLLYDLTGFRVFPPGAVIAPGDVPQVESRAALAPLDLDRVLATARQAVPGLQVGDLSLPGDPYTPIMVYGRDSVPLVYAQAAISPYDGRVMQTSSAQTQSVLQITTTALFPLHFGDFLGLWLKLVYFVFGAMLSAMVVSGMLIWTRRTALDARPARAPRKVTPA